MLVQYISDIHLEIFHPMKVEHIARIIPVKADILVLAGDIGIPHHLDNHYEKFLDILSTKFKKIFIIAGNHEFYTSYSMQSVIQKIKQIIDKMPNISFLNNSWEDYDGFRWIGTTLWSEVDENTPYLINDTAQIQGLTPSSYNLIHLNCKTFLTKTLDFSKDKKCIIITHHIPSYSLIDAEYLSIDKTPYNQWFAANLDCLILAHSNTIKAWFYGHTHIPSIHQLESIQFVCNPIGYPNENIVKDYSKTIKL